jgi:hypothetical protein
MPLYHFTKLSTFLDHILPAGTLRSNSLANMNDPRESHDWSFGSINLPLEKIFPDYYSDKTHIDCQFKVGKMVKDRFQVICFSGAKHKGWDNEMMWAHYAERQSGLCLEFDEELLLAAIRNHYPSTRYELKDVSYERKSSEKPWINWDGRLSNDENISNFLEVLSRQVTFNKSHFWEKEDEKRLLFLNHAEPLLIPYENALKAIHLGLGIPKPQHAGIYNAINEKGIKLKVMIYQNDRYERWNLSKKDMKWWTSKGDDNS